MGRSTPRRLHAGENSPDDVEASEEPDDSEDSGVNSPQRRGSSRDSSLDSSHACSAASETEELQTYLAVETDSTMHQEEEYTQLELNLNELLERREEDVPEALRLAAVGQPVITRLSDVRRTSTVEFIPGRRRMHEEGNTQRDTVMSVVHDEKLRAVRRVADVISDATAALEEHGIDFVAPLTLAQQRLLPTARMREYVARYDAVRNEEVRALGSGEEVPATLTAGDATVVHCRTKMTTNTTQRKTEVRLKPSQVAAYEVTRGERR